MLNVPRDKLGTFNTLLPELCAGEKYFQYLRIDVAIVDELHALVEPEIIQKLGFPSCLQLIVRLVECGLIKRRSQL